MVIINQFGIALLSNYWVAISVVASAGVTITPLRGNYVEISTRNLNGAITPYTKPKSTIPSIAKHLDWNAYLHLQRITSMLSVWSYFLIFF
jgi:hypothetical protein